LLTVPPIKGELNGFAVLLIGGLVFAAGYYTPMSGQMIAAYAITWLLLLTGVRQAFQYGAKAADAGKLRDKTVIPRFIWALVWMAGTLGALAVGGRILILHHYGVSARRRPPYRAECRKAPPRMRWKGLALVSPRQSGWLPGRPDGARRPPVPRTRAKHRLPGPPHVSGFPSDGPVSNVRAIVTASLSGA